MPALMARTLALLCLVVHATAYAPVRALAARAPARRAISMGPFDNLNIKLPKGKGASAPSPPPTKTKVVKQSARTTLAASAAPAAKKASFSLPKFSRPIGGGGSPAARTPIRAANPNKGNVRAVGGAGYTYGDIASLQAKFCFVPIAKNNEPRQEFWEVIAERREAIAAQKPPPPEPKGPIRTDNINKGLIVRDVGNAQSFAGTKKLRAISLAEEATGVKVPDLPALPEVPSPGTVLASLPRPGLPKFGKPDLPDLPYISGLE